MEKKNNRKAGLYFGVFMSGFFILQQLFTIDQLTARHVLVAILLGLVSGGLSGLLFGWLMGLFAKSRFVQATTKIDRASGENILFETGANHFKGLEGVGGRLCLTNKRLVFKSHKMNIQNHELSILLGDIREVSRYKTLGIVNNGLAIHTIQDRKEKFVVEKIDEWQQRIAREIDSSK